jgi:hypothetical protein
MDKGSINQTPTRILTGDEYFTTSYSPDLLRCYGGTELPLFQRGELNLPPFEKGDRGGFCCAITIAFRFNNFFKRFENIRLSNHYHAISRNSKLSNYYPSIKKERGAL